MVWGGKVSAWASAQPLAPVWLPQMEAPDARAGRELPSSPTACSLSTRKPKTREGLRSSQGRTEVAVLKEPARSVLTLDKSSFV